ncbi:hypothetical protein J2S09_003099 [Bacillus fengqiuensis]|nr:hypothetical protein [Bacillus fengqiuensis]
MMLIFSIFDSFVQNVRVGRFQQMMNVNEKKEGTLKWKRKNYFSAYNR